MSNFVRNWYTVCLDKMSLIFVMGYVFLFKHQFNPLKSLIYRTLATSSPGSNFFGMMNVPAIHSNLEASSNTPILTSLFNSALKTSRWSIGTVYALGWQCGTASSFKYKFICSSGYVPSSLSNNFGYLLSTFLSPFCCTWLRWIHLRNNGWPTDRKSVV